MEGNEDGKFDLSMQTISGVNVAEIFVAGNLDRETTEFYKLKVQS